MIFNFFPVKHLLLEFSESIISRPHYLPIYEGSLEFCTTAKPLMGEGVHPVGEVIES
jgi:hypothetical protein